MAVFEVFNSVISQWIDTQGVLLFLLVLLVVKYLNNLPPKNYPPGPLPLPFIGNVLNINIMDPIGSCKKLAVTYGDVSSLDLGGGNPCVLLSGLKGFREAFVEQAEAFTDRPSYPLNDRLSKGLGLVSSSGHMWRQQRRFALSTLKYFGVGKKTLEDSILQESQLLCDAYLAKRGLPFNPHHVTNNAVANIICTLVFGRRFEYNDQYFHHMMKCADDVLQLPATFCGRMYNQFPTVMSYLPGKHHTVFAQLQEVKEFIRAEVEKHREDKNPSDPRDYIDCYLNEIEKNKDESAGFTEENLLFCVVDLFGAGTETTSTTLRWAILYMTKYPEIQDKVHAEIDHVVGQSRQPSMDDRVKMPYTYAVIHEIQRFGNIVPFTPPRVANKDTTVAGYVIPKGVMILPLLKPILEDRSEYAAPDQFNPGHFLDDKGHFVKRDNFIPFSIGKRMCPGEQLARMELFLFFTSLFQRFSFQAPDGCQLDLTSELGITSGPVPYKICALAR
ncbi:cytochrome P450 2J4-like [Osmerus eperlanus]|uniref:cytochrome P450 2J4-like n=1 Tax=Osmerus eperlanus TaxID=29151 RepID=UPI002E1032D7